MRRSTILAVIGLPFALVAAAAVGMARLIADYNTSDFGNISYDPWDIDDPDWDEFGYYDDSPEWECD